MTIPKTERYRYKWLSQLLEQLATRTKYAPANADAVPADSIAFSCAILQSLPREGIWSHGNYLVRISINVPANFAGANRAEEIKNIIDSFLYALEDIRKSWRSKMLRIEEVDYENQNIDIAILLD